MCPATKQGQFARSKEQETRAGPAAGGPPHPPPPPPPPPRPPPHVRTPRSSRKVALSTGPEGRPASYTRQRNWKIAESNRTARDPHPLSAHPPNLPPKPQRI